MKVLIVRVGAMGDVLHALPGVAALKRARPDAVVDWVIDERWESLLTDGGPGPLVRRTFPVKIREWKAKPFAASTWKDVFAFRELRGQYDVVVDMQGTLRSALIGWMAGGKARLAGFATPREEQAAWFYGRKGARRGRHVVEQGTGLLGEVFALSRLQPAAASLPRIAWAEEWAETEAVLRRPLCLLAAGGGWGAKQWPAEKFGELAVRLSAMGFDVVVNAARQDDAIAQQVVETSGGVARMVVCNVAGLVALMRRVDLCVGGDSGPMHLAATLAVPVVALFGPTSPERNGPWGPGPSVVLRDRGSVTTYKRTPETEMGLARMKVEEVVAAVREVTGR